MIKIDISNSNFSSRPIPLKWLVDTFGEGYWLKKSLENRKDRRWAWETSNSGMKFLYFINEEDAMLFKLTWL